MRLLASNLPKDLWIHDGPSMTLVYFVLTDTYTFLTLQTYGSRSYVIIMITPLQDISDRTEHSRSSDAIILGLGSESSSEIMFSLAPLVDVTSLAGTDPSVYSNPYRFRRVRGIRFPWISSNSFLCLTATLLFWWLLIMLRNKQSSSLPMTPLLLNSLQIFLFFMSSLSMESLCMSLPTEDLNSSLNSSEL